MIYFNIIFVSTLTDQSV